VFAKYFIEELLHKRKLVIGRDGDWNQLQTPREQQQSDNGLGSHVLNDVGDLLGNGRRNLNP
jgi:hypothetical protein